MRSPQYALTEWSNAPNLRAAQLTVDLSAALLKENDCEH